MNTVDHPVLGRGSHPVISPIIPVVIWVLIGLIAAAVVPVLHPLAVTIIHFSLLLAAGLGMWLVPQPRERWGTLWQGNCTWLEILGWGLLVGVPTWVVLNYGVQPLVIWIMETMSISVPEAQTDIRATLTRGDWQAWVQILITIGLVPLAEEVFYRGAVFTTAAARLGIWVGFGFQALFFGFVHMNPVVVVVTALLGVINGYMVLRKVAMAILVVIHVVFNLLSIIVVLF